MSARDLKLQVIFNMIERVTAPLKRIVSQSSASGKALKALRDRLKEMDAQQKNITGFRRMSASLRETSGRLGATQQKVKELAEQIQNTQNPTRAMTREFERATKAARLIKEQLQRESQQLQTLRSSLHTAGISTQQLSAHERTLRNNMAATNTQIAAQQHQLAALARRHEQVSAAKQRMEKTRTVAGNMAMNGAGMAMAGTAMGVPVIKSLDQAAQFQQQTSRLRALGIGEHMVQEGVKFAKGMDIMGSSSLENLKLLTEAQSILRDFHHAQEVTPLLAKMKFGIEGVMQQRGGGEGHGEAAERMFMDLIKVAELRGALKDMDTFKRVLDFSTKAYVASGGLVKPEDLLNMIKTGGVAAKQLSDDSFFFGMLHNIQEMGGDRTGTALMSAYQNWAVGRTTQQTAEELHKDGLIDPDAIKYGKTGHITKMRPDALLNADKYKSDPFKYLMEDVLPKIQKPGMTDNQVISKITTLFSSRNAANLMSSMYLERANIQKHRDAAKGAYGIDQLNKESGSGVNGQYLALVARRNTLEQQLGEHLLPLVNKGLEMLTSTIQSLTGFFDRHQGVAKALTITFAGLAAVLLVMGTATLGLAALIGPFAILRFGMVMLGIRGGLLAGTFARLGAAFARIGPFLARVGGWLRGLLPALRLAGNAVMWLGRAFLVAGRFLLMNPIGLAITAIAVAAYLIYRNWSRVSAFFMGLWGEVKQAFNGGIAGVGALLLNWSPLGLFHRAMAGVLGYFGIDIPAKFTEFGSFMMHGLVNGITSAASTVRDTISNMADNVVSWFKEKLGIHSPSVVFAELGQFTMQGLSIGIEKAQALPLDKLQGVTKQMSAIGTGLAFSAAINPAFAQVPPPLFNPQQVALVQFAAQQPQPPHLAEPIKFDSRPPVQSQGSNTASAGNNAAPAASNIQIVINPAAGTDPQAIAKAVAAELDRRERHQAQQRRSAMHDYDES
ncbi:phage tail tape measure protein [Undibacterium sp. TC4M20W]|uniref:phage tail tape measure protein n=1 Tax=Undibacterium sp. TC4M20W TaxID=3413052 RepID=UPI003BF32D0D